MDYLQIGLFLGGATLIAFPLLCFKYRLFNENVLEDLYDWWDGDNDTYSSPATSIILFILITILAALIMIVVWSILLPLYFFITLFINVRNKRVALMKENKLEELYGKNHKH